MGLVRAQTVFATSCALIGLASTYLEVSIEFFLSAHPAVTAAQPDGIQRRRTPVGNYRGGTSWFPS
jgi:hypothetical protein